MITIQTIHLDDYEGFAKVEKEVSELHARSVPWKFQHTDWNSMSKEYFEELISQRDTISLIAKEKNEIVGFTIAYPVESENIPILKPKKWMFLMSFWVKESHKRKWIGSKLLENLEAESKNAWYDSIGLSVWNFNEEAIDFYKKRWFEPFSIKMRKPLSYAP